MNQAVVLRPSRPGDLEQIAALFHASVHQVAGADYTARQLAAWSPPGFDRDRWRDRLTGEKTVIAETPEGMAGFCSWTVEGYLDLLFVHPACLRRGVATALYAAAEQFLRDHRVPRVHTQASVTAQPFFLRQGFRLVQHQTVHVRGVDLPNAIMEKLLA